MGFFLFVFAMLITLWALVLVTFPVPLAVIVVGLGSMLYYVSNISHDPERGKIRRIGLSLLRRAGAAMALAGTVILLGHLMLVL
jgi:hypothetical protein